MSYPNQNLVVADYPIDGKQSFDPSGIAQFTAVQANALEAITAGAGFGGTTITRTALIALAEADGLTPGAIYLTTDGLLCIALTARYLQPLSHWFIDGRPWSVGSNTLASDLTYCYLPPLAPNAAVDIYHEWKMDGVNVTKRGRIYIDGTLGGGITGAQAIYTRNYTDTNPQVNIYSRMQNRGDASSQICLTLGDSTSFGSSSSALVELAVNTNTSKLLRAMGETSKSGSNVTPSSITFSGGLATVTKTTHGLVTGDSIGVTDATEPEYNVDPVQITKLTADTFTYPVSGSPASPAGGTPVYQKYINLALVSFRVMIYQGLGF